MPTAIFAAIMGIVDKLIPDPAAAAAAKIKALELAQAGQFKELDAAVELAKSQAATNTAEAASGNAFAAGWRPSIGYVCALALAYQYLARPLIIGFTAHKELPALDGSLMELVVGMLGLGTMRTIEKLKGKE